MNLMEYFDPNNIDHLKAADHLIKKGSWPEWFITTPDGELELNHTDSITLFFVLGACWIQHKLSTQTEG